MNSFNRAILCTLVAIGSGLFATAALAQCKDSTGVIIFDMTANPGDMAIDVNLNLEDPCGSKKDTAIDDGYGGNAINIDDFQVMSRNVYTVPNQLQQEIGITDHTVVQNRIDDPGTENTHFVSGGHLFDLDRLRTIANWMSSGSPAISTTLPNGTYGTISYAQFMNNIVNNRTMYGMVRVLLPLQLGACVDTKGNCDRNALGGVVNKTTLYGLCTTATGGCLCAPMAAKNQDIAVGNTICGNNVAQVAAPNNLKIKVKGSLLWDFVASENNPAAGLSRGDPIPLELLPWAPRELYFKVIIPILVNWEHDANNDGAMDNMSYIGSLVPQGEPGDVNSPVTPTIDFTKVPASSKADFKYYTGIDLTTGDGADKFALLSRPTQYHLLMPSGYATAWEEAFARLGITGNEWTSIPGVTPALKLPSGVTGTITANHVRHPLFEDIPAYLYSGGLIDMHDQVNISGLVYVPQGMELEAKNGNLASPQPTRQFVNGAIIVRDTFFIEAKDTTITVISSDPTVYSAALLSYDASRSSKHREFSYGGSVAGDAGSDDIMGDDDSPPPNGTNCYLDCTPGGTNEEDMSSERALLSGRWIEVRPQPAVVVPDP